MLKRLTTTSQLVDRFSQVHNETSLVLPLCEREEIIHGEWVATTLPEIPYVPHYQCRPEDHYRTGRPWETWEWQPLAATPHRCSFERWDAARFCSLVRFSTVAFVGDSLSWEQYTALVQLMGHLIAEKQHIDSAWQGKIISRFVCGGQVRLVFLRNDDLTLIPKVVNATSPSVLVINRGAHYTPDSPLRDELSKFVIPALQNWQESCKISQRRCQLLVRTTIPGHPKCWNFTRPTTNVTEMEVYISDPSNYDETQLEFHWHDFQNQNIMSLQLYQEANLTFDVLDAYYTNILRPDDHIHSEDCLHNCFPGKIDVYNQLVLHFLHKRGGVAAPNATWIVPEAHPKPDPDLYRHHTLCARDQIRHGEWIQRNMPEIPYSPHTHCLPEENYQPGKPWKTWDWQPFAVKAHNCTLVKWDSSHFCSLARFTTVAFVGDSMSSWEQFASLVQLLGGFIHDSSFHQLRDGQIMLEHVCQGQVRLALCRDDHLQHIDNVIRKTSPHVLVLSHGSETIDDKSLRNRL